MNFSAGRLIMEASRAGLFPFGRTFGHVDPRVQSPVNAYLLQYVLTILYTLIMPRGAVYQFYIAFTGYPHYVRNTQEHIIVPKLITLSSKRPSIS